MCGDCDCFQGCGSSKAQTIIVRGANDYMLDEIERSLHDSLSIVKRTLESNQVVPGGGAVEAALCVYLEDFAETMVCHFSHFFFEKLNFSVTDRLFVVCLFSGHS
jgi:chaperonin GroEL (HSP60 family)